MISMPLSPIKISVILLVLLGFINPVFSQSSAGSNVFKFSMASPQLVSLRQIWVYLPGTYNETDKAYPVLYLQDAQNLFDNSTSFSGEWRVDEILDSLKTELIVVGIEHGNDKRIDELTPYPHQEYKGGKAENYLDFIITSLMPEIKHRYRTLQGPESTFIGGSSLGGLFAYYSIIKNPEIFGKALIFSPSFWYSDDIFHLTETIETQEISKIKMYFRAGEQESETMVPLMFKKRQQLIDKGLSPCNLNILGIPDGKHNEGFWSSQFPNAVLWLMKD